MLSSAGVYPTIPVVDLKRARKFYEEKLGLKVIEEDPSPGGHSRSWQGHAALPVPAGGDQGRPYRSRFHRQRRRGRGEAAQGEGRQVRGIRHPEHGHQDGQRHRHHGAGSGAPGSKTPRATSWASATSSSPWRRRARGSDGEEGDQRGRQRQPGADAHHPAVTIDE